MNLTRWAWLILPLGMCRATQIALVDRIFATPRAWLLRRLNPRGLAMDHPERPYLSYLLECPWCLSIWIAAAVIALMLWGSARQIVLAVMLVLALSLLAVALDRAFDRWLPDPPPEPAPPAEQPPSYVSDTFDQLGDEHAEPT